MNHPLKINTRAVRRVVYTMTAALLVVATLPLFQGGRAAAAQLSTRSITMSDSSVSGTTITSGVGSGTNVIYQVAFTSTTQASSMVIDFCQQDPIINDACTTPTGMNASAATLNAAAITGTVTTANNWAVTAAPGQVKLKDDAVAAHDIQASSNEVFTLSGITNSSTVGTFYARMYTYTNNTWGTYAGPDSTLTPPGAGNYVDYGGIAMSTTRVITITARVQESLMFCVTSANPDTWTTTHDCSDTAAAAQPAIVIGHGTPTAILDSNNVDSTPVYTMLSTNATHGAVINMRNSNLLCGGLSADNGATCAIPPIAAGAAGTHAMAAGTAAFGLYVDTYTSCTAPGAGCGEGYAGAGSFNTIGSMTPTANYNDTTHTFLLPPIWYGMDNSTPNNNVTSTYGSTTASTLTPVYRAYNEYTFAATAALTTPAGIYTANLSLIATGTF